MSNPAVSRRTSDSRDAIFGALADEQRREILRIVRERSPSRIDKSDLAYELAAVIGDKRLADVTDDEYRRALVDCQHRSLPALIDAGLLAGTDDDAVVATDHWAFDDSELATVLDGRTDAREGDLDALFDSLADARRRTILTVLGNQYHAISTETLARDVAARESGTAERDVSQDRLERVHSSLVHSHLPRLRDAGLVGYDADAGSVSYEGHPMLRTEWLEDGADDPSSDADDSDVTAETDVRTLQGRETIITTGQSLCERAEDELFMMFTTTGLLEEGCFRRIEDALDRGVDVYLGSSDPRVRELVRERTPDVVLWEPQQDWLNLPPNGESIGRLVFADREAVMLGTFGPPAGNEETVETAIVGDGPDNGLVTLMRQLLGSRLDRLDEQTELAQAELPL
ncbi:DUF7344 domain-containing protein [Haloterrigena alkaliphila]|uniref:DUF7344 domain-containing protein n=1 Tax=Haloterrigena alkaliphila TaxID=2816475 RepID=A0A8A2VCC3_9EURY|nr:hypothetical protein [Haloterrigena alkaliphila]QSW98826.1 hypothetical protein J0X25_15750 [Haloterrigena alkaliphila]